MKVDNKTLIKDIVHLGPNAIETLMGFGMRCIGCPASQNETIEEAATAHGIPVGELIHSLNTI